VLSQYFYGASFSTIFSMSLIPETVYKGWSRDFHFIDRFCSNLDRACLPVTSPVAELLSKKALGILVHQCYHRVSVSVVHRKVSRFSKAAIPAILQLRTAWLWHGEWYLKRRFLRILFTMILDTVILSTWSQLSVSNLFFTDDARQVILFQPEIVFFFLAQPRIDFIGAKNDYFESDHQSNATREMNISNSWYSPWMA
jgi:hypothetical protein